MSSSTSFIFKYKIEVLNTEIWGLYLVCIGFGIVKRFKIESNNSDNIQLLIQGHLR